MNVKPARAVNMIDTKQQVIAARLEIQKHDVLERERTANALMRPDDLPVVPDLQSLIRSREQHHRLCDRRLDAAIDVEGRTRSGAELLDEVEQPIVRHRLPGERLRARAIARTQIGWAGLGRMDARQAARAVIERSDGPRTSERLQWCVGEPGPFGALPQPGDCRLDAGIIQERQKIGRLEPDRFGRVVKALSEQRKNRLLVGGMFRRLPMLGDSKHPDAAEFAQVDRFVQILHAVDGVFRPGGQRKRRINRLRWRRKRETKTGSQHAGKPRFVVGTRAHRFQEIKRRAFGEHPRRALSQVRIGRASHAGD